MGKTLHLDPFQLLYLKEDLLYLKEDLLYLKEEQREEEERRKAVNSESVRVTSVELQVSWCWWRCRGVVSCVDFHKK